MEMYWAILAALFLGYIVGSEIERYRNKESAMGYLAEIIEEKVGN